MRILTTLLVTSVMGLSAHAAEEDTPRDFGFRPLEIFKFEPGTSRLVVTDLNNDGLDDILLANNHISRLEILLRKPEGEKLDDLPELDDRFEDKGIIVDQGIKALRVADLNGDGLKDIATFGTAIGLQIRYQKEDGSFNMPERVFIKQRSTVTTIQVGDLNGDTLKDILVAHRDEAELLWNDTERPFREKKTLTFADDKSFFGDIADVNDDGIPDLAFHFSSARNPLKIRFGEGEGVFGIEQPVDLPPRQYMDILQAEGAPPRVGMVLRNRLAFRLYDFVKKDQPKLMEALEISPGRIGLEGSNKKAPPAWIADDFNHDGYDDLLIAAPELSRLHLYSGTAEGLNPEPQRIDTLSEVTRMSRFANGDILVVSKKEKIAAVHKADDLARFPEILKMPGDTLAGCAIEANDEAWFICKDSDKQLMLVKRSGSAEHEILPLDMKNDPNDLLAFNLPNGQVGLLLFMPYATPQARLFDGEKLEELTSESFRALTQKISLSNLRLGAPGEGSVMVVSQGAIARRFEWKGDRYEVTRQYNPETPRAALNASTSFELLDGSKGAFFYDRDANDLIRFSEDGEDWGKIHIPDADQTIFNLVQLKHPTRDIIVLLDNTGVNEITGNGTKLDLEVAAEYTSPSETPLLAYAKLVQLASPPRPMVALVDPNNRAIELVRKEGEELKLEMAFEVFLASDFANTAKTRGSEPHDVESGDLNGDGVGDLVVLAHDKLLIYLGE